MTARLTVDGVPRQFNPPTTTVRIADPLKLPVGEARECELLDWYSLLQADDPEDLLPMDLAGVPR